jgi:Chaperone for protein-folding within the ER, fungal
VSDANKRFRTGTDPRCIIGVVQFQHGTHELLSNGSIILNPFEPDGRQQIQNPCAAESNVLQQFNQTTLFLSWRIFVNPTGVDKLHLFRFDGAPLPPMFRVSTVPTMLPTRVLTNTTIGSQAQKRSLPEKRSAADPTHPIAIAGLSAAGLLSLGLLSLL